MFDLIFTVVIWGFSFALAKKALHTLTAYELVTLRLALGTLTVFLITRFFEKASPKTVSFSKGALLLGVFEFAGTYILYTLSLGYLPSGVVATLTLMTPVFTYVLGVLSGVDRLKVAGVLATLLSFVGAFLCLPLQNVFAQLSNDSAIWTGALLITASNLCFAVGNVAISKLHLARQWDNHLTYKGLRIGALIALIICLFTSHTSLESVSSIEVWYLPFYLGVVATGVGFFLWNRGVQKVSATPAALIGNFKAPLSVLWGAILLGEAVTGRLLAGLFVLVLSTRLLPPKKS